MESKALWLEGMVQTIKSLHTFALFVHLSLAFNLIASRDLSVALRMVHDLEVEIRVVGGEWCGHKNGGSCLWPCGGINQIMMSLCFMFIFCCWWWWSWCHSGGRWLILCRASLNTSYHDVMYNCDRPLQSIFKLWYIKTIHFISIK